MPRHLNINHFFIKSLKHEQKNTKPRKGGNTMTRYYLCIYAQELTRSTRFFYLKLGTNAHDIAVKRMLTDFASKSSDYYFRAISDETDIFLGMIAKSLDTHFRLLNRLHVNGRQILKILPTAHVKNLSLYK